MSRSVTCLPLLIMEYHYSVFLVHQSYQTLNQQKRQPIYVRDSDDAVVSIVGTMDADKSYYIVCALLAALLLRKEMLRTKISLSQRQACCDHSSTNTPTE